MGLSSGGGGGRLASEICEPDKLLSSSSWGGGGGSESRDNVDRDNVPPKSSGGGGNENMESVIQDGIISNGLAVTTFMNMFAFPAVGVLGILGEGVGVGVDALDPMLSTELRPDCLRFSVPLLPLSSLRFLLCRRVRVPPRSGDVGTESNLVFSPTSLSLPVIDVNGMFGFIVGLRFIVPVVNSDSNALLSSDKHPLELELDARDSRPLLAVPLLPLLPVLH